MVYQLAKWLWAQARGHWHSWFARGFFGRLCLLPFQGPLWLFCGVLSMLLFAASFMKILENIAKSIFFFFKNKFWASGFIGKIFYLPFLLMSMLFCLLVIVLSIGSANPFGGGDS